MCLSNLISRFKIVSLTVLFMVAACSRPLRADQLKIDNPEKVLRAHGVAVTEHAVVAALRNKDLEVRRAASDVLTKRWPKVAVSAIQQSISKEPEGFTRIWMATGLARLGDAAGRQALRKEYRNTAEWGSVRVEAAAVLSEEFGDYSCTDSILTVLQSDSDPRDTSAKEHALELAPRLIVHLAPLEAHNVFELVVKALSDPWPGVRTTASTMLDQIGDPAAIPTLEAAIAKEKDENGRRMMMNNLRNLKSKQQMQRQ
jgi:HEAT repeat protein